MTITPRSIALQGFLLTPLAMALQGLFAPADVPTRPGAGSRPGYNPWAPWPHHYVPHRRPKKRRQADILFL